MPAAASVPVASMVWIGFQRPPNRPDWIGSFNDRPSEKVLPFLINLPALTMSSGDTLLRVPIWSSLPQRPQFDNFSAASIIAARLTGLRIGLSLWFHTSCNRSSARLARSGPLWSRTAVPNGRLLFIIRKITIGLESSLQVSKRGECYFFSIFFPSGGGLNRTECSANLSTDKFKRLGGAGNDCLAATTD